MAELGYHYLLSGGLGLSRAIFEGLVAVDPDEAYFALALGLTLDRLGDLDGAEAMYRRAGSLDPADGHADVNLAELALADGAWRRAHKRLAAGVRKAKARGDSSLERKARALLSHVGELAQVRR